MICKPSTDNFNAKKLGVITLLCKSLVRSKCISLNIYVHVVVFCFCFFFLFCFLIFDVLLELEGNVELNYDDWWLWALGKCWEELPQQSIFSVPNHLIIQKYSCKQVDMKLKPWVTEVYLKMVMLATHFSSYKHFSKYFFLNVKPGGHISSWMSSS